MERLAELRRRLMFRLRRRQFDRDLQEEMQSHLAMKAGQNRADGMSPDEAQHAARRRFGSGLAWQEASRDAWSWRWLDAIARDIRHGLRGFLRDPGFTAVALLTLALGLGANTAIFAVLYNVVLRPLPYPDADRLVKVYLTHNDDQRGPRDVGFSHPKYLALQRENTVFDSMAGYALRQYVISAPGPAEEVSGELATASYFPMLGIVPALGRTFLPEEDRDQGAHPVVILGDALWRARFNADPAAIGKTIRLDWTVLNVIGVAPPGVLGDSGRAAFWLPFSMCDSDELVNQRGYWHQAIAHLKPGVPTARAATQVKTIMARVEAQQHTFPGIWDANVVSLAASKIDRALAHGLIILYAAAGLVLLIACANLANLTVARMVGRRREMAVRVAIGAGRGALIRQVLVENVLLSMVGGLAGTLLAAGGMRLLSVLRPDVGSGDWPTYMYQLDARAMHVTAQVAVFGLLLSFAAGILFGLAPALRASRAAVHDVLKGGAPSGNPRRRTIRFRSLLQAGQLAIVVVLLATAGLMIRAFARLTSVPLGVEAHNVLLVPLSLPYQRYNDAASRQFFDRLLDQARALPTVEALTIAEAPPTQRWITTLVESIDGVQTSQYIDWNSVDPGFLELFHIPLRAGRPFDERDRHGPRVCVLSERAARALFPHQSPLGHRIKANRRECEIVGVAPDIRYQDEKQQLPVVGQVYLAPARTGGDLLVIRTARNPTSLVPALRRIVSGLDPEIPFRGAYTLDDSIFLAHSYERFATVLLGVFAALALSLALTGIYGVFSYSTAARTREFGIRLATGALSWDILTLVLREAAFLCAAGLAAGIPAAILASRVVAAVMNPAPPTTVWTYAATALVMVVTALAASYIPARRAAKLDPVAALRCE